MSVKHGKGLSGTFASATLNDVTNFNVNDANKAADYVSSSTNGETKRVAGANDSTGSFTMLSDTMPSALTKGATGTLVLKSDNATTVYSKSVIIQNISYTVDANGLIQANITFGQS